MDILSPNDYMIPPVLILETTIENTVLCISVAHMYHKCVKNIRTYVFHVISSIVKHSLYAQGICLRTTINRLNIQN